MGDSTRSNDRSSGRSNPGMQQNSNLQSGRQEIAGNKQSTGKQNGRTQEGRQHDSGSRQGAGAQQQNQQHGGQHASGGTPALDDLNADRDSRDQGSPGSGSRQMDQQSDWQGKQDKQR